MCCCHAARVETQQQHALETRPPDKAREERLPSLLPYYLRSAPALQPCAQTAPNLSFPLPSFPRSSSPSPSPSPSLSPPTLDNTNHPHLHTRPHPSAPALPGPLRFCHPAMGSPEPHLTYSPNLQPHPSRLTSSLWALCIPRVPPSHHSPSDASAHHYAGRIATLQSKQHGYQCPTYCIDCQSIIQDRIAPPHSCHDTPSNSE
jgi:hypothetical protein